MVKGKESGAFFKKRKSWKNIRKLQGNAARLAEFVPVQNRLLVDFALNN